jgi:hypothetical protein
MLKSIARSRIRAFSKHYDYDTSYMETVLDTSPAAFFKFANLTKAAQHRESAPIDAYFAAKIAGARAEDCGPCTQLVVDMALEAGMARDQIEAVLRRDFEAMSDDTVLGFRFAEAVIHRAPNENEVRDAVRVAWGEKGVIDLTFSLQLGRMFPMVKAGLGFAKECRRVTVGDKAVDVAPLAA